jgi:excisionase family DNA binding protein
MNDSSSRSPGGRPVTSTEVKLTTDKENDAGHTPLLNTEGVAAWLGISHRHVRRLVAERRIPYVKLGHYVRFDCEEVAAWIDRQRVSSTRPTD